MAWNLNSCNLSVELELTDALRSLDADEAARAMKVANGEVYRRSSSDLRYRDYDPDKANRIFVQIPNGPGRSRTRPTPERTAYATDGFDCPGIDSYFALRAIVHDPYTSEGGVGRCIHLIMHSWNA